MKAKAGKMTKKDRTKARRAKKPAARRAVKRQRSMKYRFEAPTGELPAGNYKTTVKDVDGDTTTLTQPTGIAEGTCNERDQPVAAETAPQDGQIAPVEVEAQVN